MGVNRAVAIAYWLGNPLLNPAVLVFLLFIAPWQWTLTRLLVGAATVVVGSALVASMTRRSQASQPPSAGAPWMSGTEESIPAATRFLQVLLRLCLVLLPEYLIMVLVIGAGRGRLLTLIQPAHQGVLVVLLAAVLGTLMVIPTAGEIAILQTPDASRRLVRRPRRTPDHPSGGQPARRRDGGPQHRLEGPRCHHRRGDRGRIGRRGVFERLPDPLNVRSQPSNSGQRTVGTNYRAAQPIMNTLSFASFEFADPVVGLVELVVQCDESGRCRRHVTSS